MQLNIVLLYLQIGLKTVCRWHICSSCSNVVGLKLVFWTSYCTQKLDAQVKFNISKAKGVADGKWWRRRMVFDVQWNRTALTRIFLVFLKRLTRSVFDLNIIERWGLNFTLCRWTRTGRGALFTLTKVRSSILKQLNRAPTFVRM